jgi:hypothetical protein
LWTIVQKEYSPTGWWVGCCWILNVRICKACLVRVWILVSCSVKYIYIYISIWGVL